ncbi:transposase domain-containing protein [Xanthobacter sp. DSM 24535]|uniref:transposase domain-containing protein n=1 Tax=Roseixanthobacter psychrophilus TaxID=3119917 RepID=UPI003728AA15
MAEARLPDMPGERENIARKAENWRQPEHEYPANPKGHWRRREGRGGGYEYHYSCLPLRARTTLIMRQKQAEKAAPAPVVTAAREEQRSNRWDWFEGLPDRLKARAKEKLDALQAVDALTRTGQERDLAMIVVASEVGVSLRTLYNWASEVHGIDRADWLAYLAPRYAGRQTTVDCDPAAWEWMKGAYLTQSQPTAAHCFRQLEKVAKEQGWIIPSCKTLERRLAKLDPAIVVFYRQGKEALKRLYPAQKRDRSTLHALEAVNADGHNWDVFVEFPNGEICRPWMVGFQDLHSGMILSWRIDTSENKDLVRLAFSDLVETYGIPEHVLFDNGRSFASKQITGGQKNRYRFKVKDEEPEGIITAFGCEVHWATPYHGQAKPIERAWRDLAQNVARDPRFAGAWTGNSVANKPENYGTKAVPLETFLAIVTEGIIEHNTRAGRRTEVCAGRLSFAEAYALSIANGALIKRASEQQLRRLLLTSDLVTARAPDGAVWLEGNRYWSEFLVGHMGKKVMVRFDPDALHDRVYIYRPDGAFLGEAPCLEAAGFFSTAASRVHARARNDFLRATKAAAAAERKLTPEQVGALMAKIEAPEPPENKVVRPLFGAGGTALKQAYEHDQEEVLEMFGRAVRKLHVVRKENGADD